MQRRPLPALIVPALLLAAGCGDAGAPAAPAPPAHAPAEAAPPAAAPTTVTATATTTVAVAAAPLPEEGTAPGRLVPAFAAEGSGRTVDSRAPGAVTVYCAGSTTCPYTNKYAAAMQALEAAFSAQGVQFVWLYPNRTESDADKTAWHTAKGLAGTFVLDRDAAVTRTLGIERTPEVVVTDARGVIRYRGAIDDGAGDPAKVRTEHLRLALGAVLAGEPVPVERTVPAG